MVYHKKEILNQCFKIFLSSLSLMQNNRSYTSISGTLREIGLMEIPKWDHQKQELILSNRVEFLYHRLTGGNVLVGKTIALFRDGSKFDRGTGAGLYCENLNIFQEEVAAFARGAKQLRLSTMPAKGSLYAPICKLLLALGRVANKSRAVNDCKPMLYNLTEHIT